MSRDVSANVCSVQTIASLDEFRELASTWHELWGRCKGHRTPFLDFDWARLWAEHYHMDGSLRVLVVSRDSHVLGIVPLVMHRYAVGPVGMDVAETLAGQSRNIVGLVQPGAEKSVAQAVATYIADNMLSQGTSLRLSLVPEGSSFADALVGALTACGYGGSTSKQVVSRAPYAPLPVSWEDYWGARSHKRRKLLRRASRTLEREYDVSFVDCREDEVFWGMEALYELHQKRWEGTGLRGLFADSRARAFHSAVAVANSRSGLLRVSVMMVDGKPVSSHLLGVLDGTIYLMRSGRDESLARYSIGHLHDAHLFQRSIREGLIEADFLRGAEPYKFYWTTRYRIYNDTLVAGRAGHGIVPVRFVRLWLRVAQFCEHRHSAGELLGILRIRRWEARERQRMGLDI